MQTLRTEKVERSMALMYTTGGMRRLHLRGRANIRKRLLVHACGFNLGVLMRALTGIGTPRTLQGRGGELAANHAEIADVPLKSAWSGFLDAIRGLLGPQPGGWTRIRPGTPGGHASA